MNHTIQKRCSTVMLLILLCMSTFSALFFIDSDGNAVGSESGQAINALLTANSTKNTDLIEGCQRHYSSTKYPGIYAGHYRGENGNYVVMFAKDKAAVEKSVLAPILDLKDVTCVYDAAYSYNTIVELIDIVAGKMPPMPDISGVGMAVKDNRVTVDIYQLTPEKEEQFIRTVTDHPAVVLRNMTDRLELDGEAEETEPSFVGGNTHNGKTLYAVTVSAAGRVLDAKGKTVLLKVAEGDALLAVGGTYTQNGTVWANVLLGDQAVGRIKASCLALSRSGKVLGTKLGSDASWLAVDKSAYLYQEAATRSVKAGVARKGAMVAVLGEEGDFYKVQVRGGVAYIKKIYVNGQDKEPAPAKTVAVAMRIKEGTLTPSGATIVFVNDSEKAFTYGDAYQLHQKIGGGWKAVEPIIPSLEFNDIGYELGAEQTREIAVGWEGAFGKLAPGEYRITKEVLDSRAPGDYDIYHLSVEFVIR